MGRGPPQNFFKCRLQPAVPPPASTPRWASLVQGGCRDSPFYTSPPRENETGIQNGAWNLVSWRWAEREPCSFQTHPQYSQNPRVHLGVDILTSTLLVWGVGEGRQAPLKAAACPIEGPVHRPAVYHAIFLEELTTLELIEKIANLYSISPQHIHRVYRQGPTGIHVVVSNEVSTAAPPARGVGPRATGGSRGPTSEMRPAGLGGDFRLKMANRVHLPMACSQLQGLPGELGERGLRPRPRALNSCRLSIWNPALGQVPCSHPCLGALTVRAVRTQTQVLTQGRGGGWEGAGPGEVTRAGLMMERPGLSGNRGVLC